MEDEFLGFSEEYDNACENNADDETEKDVVVCSSEALETGFLNLTQMQPCTNEMSKGVVLEPRSKFERILKNLGVEVLFDESMKEFFRIGGDLNHAMWTRKLEAYMQDKAKKSELLTHFEEEVKTSASLLLCLAPTASSFGRQDTMFRAFLLCKSSQSKAFEVLMTALNDLATSNEENSKELAFACVSQIRYLEVSYDNQAIYQSVFDSKFDTWNPTTRDAFISALPEILTDPCAQQEAALELKDMLRSEVASAASFQTAILNSLNLLRMQPSVATEVRKFLCVNCMHVDATILPLITNFSLASISTDPSASFLDFLNDFSKFLKLDNLRTLRQSRGHLGTDSIVAATFASIMRYVQLDKKAWKSLSVFLCRNIDETENPEPDVGTSSKPRKYELFDLMLLFASLSSYGCPPAVLNHLKTCLTANPAVTDQFINLCKNALSFRKFRSEYLTAFISCARQCVWSLDENLRSFGSFIYKKLLVLTEKTNQQNVFEELLSHFSRGDVECSCVLEILNMVAEEHYNAIRDFIPLIQVYSAKMYSKNKAKFDPYLK
ncbi:unnamed protein product [Caenorhabditis auriculariae]|uniref:Uncharacterized protein n=1 Tax=Caenorhabditis auriculariae TaxID=2777116 RepID=A0A8S1GVZ3_9PELO|nr:unnamed protein product [Caenorhabditis auriculariae]